MDVRSHDAMRPDVAWRRKSGTRPANLPIEGPARAGRASKVQLTSPAATPCACSGMLALACPHFLPRPVRAL
jgi:hypothetical protein